MRTRQPVNVSFPSLDLGKERLRAQGLALGFLGGPGGSGQGQRSSHSGLELSHLDTSP